MIYIAIGSNVGNRLHNIQTALQLLTERGFHIDQQSPVIETQAILPADALPDWDKPYLNMVIAGRSDEAIEALLQQLKHIEQQLGRKTLPLKWGPRVIDLDILMVDNQIVDTPSCTIPHPELLNRPFLIHLLGLMAPELRHPKTQQTFSALAYETAGMNDCYLNSFVASPKLMGIVNVTQNSFSDGGQFFAVEEACKQVIALHQQGASVIDIGAQATNPNASMLSFQQEYQRLQPVLEALTPLIIEKDLCISIDSFSEKIITQCLADYPIAWINDVKGVLSDDCLRHIATQGKTFVATHSLSIPPNQTEVIALNVSPIDTLCIWAEQKIAHLLNCGFERQQIILDPGIGYGKTPYQNIALLKAMHQLKTLGCQVLVGHSRKLFIELFSHLPAEARDIETIAVSRYLAKAGVDYLRVHNVLDHQRFFVADILS